LIGSRNLSNETYGRTAKSFGHARFVKSLGPRGSYITIGTVIGILDVRSTAGTTPSEHADHALTRLILSLKKMPRADNAKAERTNPANTASGSEDPSQAAG